MSTRWRFKPFDADKSAALSRAAGISPLSAQILLNRAIDDPDRAKAFLQAKLGQLHDPELLPGAIAAAERIVRAVREGRRIVIYGDYDVDGVCGTSVLWSCLKLAGAKDVGYYIPHRVDEGYGVNADALRKIAGEMGTSLVVTVDCGITAIEEARLARELGLELIVTDHHTPGEVLPEADVVVHPRIGAASYPCPDLCGAGVAFKLAWQVCKSFGDGKKASPALRNFLVESLGLVALATIADVVPLVGENRVLVRHGLLGIDAKPTVGVRALLEVSGCLDRGKLAAGTVAFRVAPRINAAGRLEQAMRAVEMLTTEDIELARDLAAELDGCNTRRQEIEQTMVGEAHTLVRAAGEIGERGAIVVGREGWHPGVVGIVAGRLAETYHRPTIVVALNQGQGQGSARSIAGFNVHEAIQACRDGLTGFGGHAAAAGLRLPADNLPAFALAFDQYCRHALTPEQKERVTWIDAEVPLGMLSVKLVEELDQIEPYGIGNPKPVLATSGVRLLGEPKLVGERKNHVQMRFRHGDVVVKAIAWNAADRYKSLAPDTLCSLAYHPSINEWNNRRDVQLEIRDIQVEPVT